MKGKYRIGEELKKTLESIQVQPLPENEASFLKDALRETVRDNLRLREIVIGLEAEVRRLKHMKELREKRLQDYEENHEEEKPRLAILRS